MFREYDIRGDVGRGSKLNKNTFLILGKATGTYFMRNEHDCGVAAVSFATKVDYDLLMDEWECAYCYSRLMSISSIDCPTTFFIPSFVMV